MFTRPRTADRPLAELSAGMPAADPERLLLDSGALPLEVLGWPLPPRDSGAAWT